ncbi:MAG: hypothetical protein GU362_03935 [Thaumarchaeota archaeon]|jgi:putative transposase|nr:hypothetical protein [Nitrososphaerota archaeon]
MKQALIKRLQDNVIALSKLKEKGVKVGKIKFVKAVHSIPLMQYEVTYWVKNDNKMVHIQGVGNFKVSGSIRYLRTQSFL